MKRYFTIYEEVKEQYYKIPKAFMLEESKYFEMSPMAKLIYSILSDRNSVSIKNKWVDEEKRVYFVYKQEELCKILGIKHTATARKYLKELESYELLERVRQGLNKPDRLYLLHPEVTEEEIYKILNNEETQEKEEENSDETSKINGQIKIDYQENQKIAIGQIKNDYQENQNLSSSNINNNNTNDINNIKKEKEKKKTKKEPTQTEIDEVINAYTSNEELKATLVEFVKFRKSIKRVMTTRALELLIKKLDRLANDDNTKIEILNESIMNGWNGIFPLKDNSTPKNKGGFNNESRSNTSKNNEPSKGKSEEHDAEYWKEQNRILDEMLDSYLQM